MACLRIALATCTAMLLASGCARHADTCGDARRAAGNAWKAYFAALERSRQSAASAQHDARERLDGDLQQRLAPTAQQRADEHYPRDSAGWSRAYRSAYDDACTKDDECRSWKEANAAAEATLGALDSRMPLARTALQAVSGDLKQAIAAARALPPDLEFPQLEQAQQLTLAAARDCPATGPALPR
jgi:hypothetical protein